VNETPLNHMKRKQLKNPGLQRKKELTKLIHPSHKMTKWEGSIITLINTPRFGEIRECKKCGGEQAITVSGDGTHPELRVQCAGTQ
jgi:hypothetical protein